MGAVAAGKVSRLGFLVCWDGNNDYRRLGERRGTCGGQRHDGLAPSPYRTIGRPISNVETLRRDGSR
jgi:hypothetical protein